MKLIEYVGKTASKRIVRRSDFKGLGVDQGEVMFDVADIPTRGQAELSDEAAELLLRLEPGNFREVTEDKRALAFRRPAGGTSGADEGDRH